MGYHVEAVFPDDVTGEGDFMKRPGMVALLSYLDAQPSKRYVVIFDDLKRYARDTEFHLKLKREMMRRNARRECLNFKFEDTPEGKFIETILAAQGELEREQNQRQVVQKMQARVKAGYWCFIPAVGYRYARVSGHGKLLVRDEPRASSVAEAFHGYASGRFESVVEVKRFLDSQMAFPKDRNGEVHFQRVVDMLRRSLYTGYIDVPKWGISLQPGKHEPLVSLEIWQQVQDRLDGVAKAPMRKDISEDFPLRGFVACACCGKPMTAAWSTGRSSKYPYYFCQTKGCSERHKNIRKERIEGDFPPILSALTPTRGLFLMVYTMMEELWDYRNSKTQDRIEAARRELQQIERKTDQLMERIVATDSETLVAAYENQIKKLERDKLVLHERMNIQAQTADSFKRTYRTAMEFLANPLKLWESGQLADRRALFRMAFAGKLEYCRNGGYRTAKTTLPFKALAMISPGKSEMVEPRGVEPLTS